MLNLKKIKELKVKLREDAEEISELKLEKLGFLNDISSLKEQLRIQVEQNNAQTVAYTECEQVILSYFETVEAKLEARSKIDQDCADIKKLRLENDSLLSSKTSLEGLVRSLSKVIKRQKDTIWELNLERTGFQNSISSLEEQLRTQTEKNNAQTAAYSKCEREILCYLEDAEAKAKLERTGFLNNILSLEEQLRIQTEKNNAQTVAYSESQSEIQSLRSLNTDLQETVDFLEIEKAVHEEEMNNNILNLEDQLRIQTEKNSQVSIDRDDENIEYYKQTIHDLKEQMQIQKEQDSTKILSLKSAYDLLQDNMSAFESQIMSGQESLETQMQLYELKMKDDAEEMLQLRNKISECQSENQSLKYLNNELQETVDFLEDEKVVLKEEMDNSISSLEEQLRIQRAKNNEKEQLENYKQTIQNLKEQMRLQKEQDSAKILSLKSAYDRLQNNTLSFESQIMSDHETLDNQMQLYELKMKDNAEEMLRLTNKISEYQKEVQSLKSVNTELQETVDFLEDEKIILKEEIKELEEKGQKQITTSENPQNGE
ncbi:hypothetical protein WMY93_011717 [Mugilogobius chulae]|uniref:Uncharacterized protein n=1 Tax=Mugilogobius chulae TaxID=88201 RepID=A0AAW0P6L3_9GOBI